MKQGSTASSIFDPSMRWCLLCLIAWFCILLPWAGAGAAPLHVTAAETLSTAGADYAPPPYEIAPAGPAGKWRAVVLPHVLPRPIADHGRTTQTTVVTWYRFRAPAGAAPRVLYLPRWKTDGRLAVYGDGRLIYASHGGIDWNGWNLPVWIPLDAMSGVAPPAMIVLRVEHPRTAGGGISTLWIGTDGELEWRYKTRQLLQAQLPAASSAAFLAAGLFALLVWMRVREDPLYVLFFCVAMASFLRTRHYYVGDEALLIPEAWFSWLTINSLYWMVLIMHFFLNHLHQRVTPWLDRAATAIVAAAALATMPGLVPGLDAYRIAPLAYAILLVLGVVLGTVGLVKSRRCGSVNGQLLGAWGVGGMLLGVFDWLLQINVLDPELIYLGPYTNVGAFLIFMYIVYRRYVQANEAVRDANAILQHRLAERERELDDSYRRLREIELRQTLSDERQRLMQDMHDGMGSSLVSALMVVESGRAEGPMLVDVLRNCIDDLRLTIDSMEPIQEDLLLLLATLRFRIGQRLEHAGITLHWHVSQLPPVPWLDPRSSLHVLRILQEALTNIIKHAHATEVVLSTDVDDNDILIHLSDNGVGFTPEAERIGAGKGIANQLRRAKAIGAGLTWRADVAGTRLTMRLPIRRDTAPA
jgi:signal transduction histidine kinase